MATEQSAIDTLRALLEDPNTTSVELRDQCAKCIPLPTPLRQKIWPMLLGTEEGGDPFIAWDGKCDLLNQRVIKADCIRTKAALPEFQREETRTQLEHILTFYCKKKSRRYIQGMNELVAPFLYLGLNRADAFNCFHALISKYIPNMFSDEFETLQCALKMVRYMLQYHDPKLSFFLDQYTIDSALYATSWLLTLFSHGWDMERVCALWDFYLTEDNPQLHIFIIVSLVIHKRSEILSQESVNIPEVISKLNLDSLDEVIQVCRSAKQLLQSTPKSIRMQIQILMTRANPTSEVITLADESPCSVVSSDDVLSSIMHSKENSASIRYFVIDCRPQDQHDCGHIPTSFLLDPKLMKEPEQLATLIEGLASLRGCHFSFQSKSLKPDAFTTGCIFMFLQKGFHYVSVIHEGYPSCHQVMQQNKWDLVDHTTTKCHTCLGITKYNDEDLLSEEQQPGRLSFVNMVSDASRMAKGVQARISKKIMKGIEYGMQNIYVDQQQQSMDDTDPEAMEPSSLQETNADGDTLICGEFVVGKTYNGLKWMTDPEIRTFMSHKVNRIGLFDTRLLVLTRVGLIEAEVNAKSQAKIHKIFPLRNLLKIKYKKSNQQLITLVVQRELIRGGPPQKDEEATTLQTYVIDEHATFVASVREYIEYHLSQSQTQVSAS